MLCLCVGDSPAGRTPSAARSRSVLSAQTQSQLQLQSQLQTTDTQKTPWFVEQPPADNRLISPYFNPKVKEVVAKADAKPSAATWARLAAVPPHRLAPLRDTSTGSADATTSVSADMGSKRRPVTAQRPLPPRAQSASATTAATPSGSGGSDGGGVRTGLPSGAGGVLRMQSAPLYGKSDLSASVFNDDTETPAQTDTQPQPQHDDAHAVALPPRLVSSAKLRETIRAVSSAVQRREMISVSKGTAAKVAAAPAAAATVPRAAVCALRLVR